MKIGDNGVHNYQADNGDRYYVTKRGDTVYVASFKGGPLLVTFIDNLSGRERDAIAEIIPAFHL